MTLRLVINNASGKISSNSKQPISVAKNLLDQASSILSELGSSYSGVCSILEDCKEMIGRKDCEPFANLLSPGANEDLP
ncbi:MAG: hypothetical protein SGJ02_07265 [bacterium]|nr:hypothetical protein [bacterium]